MKRENGTWTCQCVPSREASVVLDFVYTRSDEYVGRLLSTTHCALQAPWCLIPALKLLVLVFFRQRHSLSPYGRLQNGTASTGVSPHPHLRRRFRSSGYKCPDSAETGVHDTAALYPPARTRTARILFRLRSIRGLPCGYFCSAATSCVPTGTWEKR